MRVLILLKAWNKCIILVFCSKGVLKLGEGFLKDPEDVCVDKEGTIYAATRDGWIKRLHRNGSWENWKMISSPTLLGITITKEGDLIVCDSEKVIYIALKHSTIHKGEKENNNARN